MLEDLSTEEIFGLLKEHNDRHGYRVTGYDGHTFQDYLSSRNEYHESAKDEFVRPKLIAAYEARTDVWEDFKLTTERLLKDELEVFDVHLVEHLDGYLTTKTGKKRKRPSLWSADLNTPPAGVEDAAASYFSLRGFEVSLAPKILFQTLLAAYSRATYGTANLTGELDFSNYSLAQIFSANPDTLLSGIGQTEDEISAAVEACFRVELSHSMNAETHECLKLMEHLFTPETQIEKRNYMLRHMDYFDRSEFLEKEFCNMVWLGCNDRDALTEKILKFCKQIPNDFLTALFRRFAIHGFNTSGWPDLYLWNEHEFKFVEVKSPNDKVHLNQAKFYKYYMKPLGVTYNVGRVVPLKNSV
jgi:hypothetical protein